MTGVDCNEVRRLADKANDALFELEQALGERVESNPNFDLRQRVYRARIEVNQVSYAARTREVEEMK